MVAGSALSLDGSKSVLVENIGPCGAKLRGRKLPSIGEQIVVWIEQGQAFGSIAWSGFDQRGIVFDAPLSGAVLARLDEDR